MRTDEIRTNYLRFFEERDHRVCPSDSLVPSNDPTLLFTGAGMNQFKDRFLGIGVTFRRAASSQKCMRTEDILKVGLTSSHHTFFEMLGNFSFGDYFKQQAIEWAWEYLTGVLGVPERRLQASVFEDDDEAYTVWRERIGLPAERIARLGAHDNFWPADAPALGPNGPCGPCSEIFYDRGEQYGPGIMDITHPCGRWVEVWNLVFTQFDRQPDGTLKPLAQKNIDTGMGLERMAACMQDAPTNMDIDIFRPLVGAVSDLSARAYGESADLDVPMRRIADHARAVTFGIADGVLPGNTHRGYVIKRLLRRAVLDGRTLGIDGAFVHKLAPIVGRVMGEAYPEVAEAAEGIGETIRHEEEKFLSTLSRGLTLIDTAVRATQEAGREQIDGRTAFELYDTYGFPFELAEEVVAREGLSLDRDGFEENLEEARERARASAKMGGDVFAKGPLAEVKSRTPATEFVGYTTLTAHARVLAVICGDELVDEAPAERNVQVVLDRTPFYAEAGGQVGDAGTLFGPENLIVEVEDTQPFDGLAVHLGRVASGVLRTSAELEARVDAERRAAITRHHTATHLLQWALRQVFGRRVEQRGSWVGPDRMRFDFQHAHGLSDEEVHRVEELVNERVLDNADIAHQTLALDEARQAGAIALFGEKYDETVHMVSAGDFSRELCGGCHVARTGDIGAFRILSEESVAAGIRRIEGCAGLAAWRANRADTDRLARMAAALKAPPREAPDKLEGLLDQERRLRKELADLRRGDLAGRLSQAAQDAPEVAGVPCLAFDAGEVGGRALREAANTVRKAFPRGVALLGGVEDGKASLLCLVSDEFQARGLRAGDIVREAAGYVGGRGGGRADMAQAGGREAGRLPQALAALPEIVRDKLTDAHREEAQDA